MFRNKIGIIALILLLFLSLSIVQACDSSQDLINSSSDNQISPIDGDQISNNDLIENSQSNDFDLDSNDFDLDSNEDIDLDSNEDIDLDSNEDIDLDSNENDDLGSNDNSIQGNSIKSSTSQINSNKLSSSNLNAKTSTKLSANKVKTYYKEKSSLLIYLKDSGNNPLKNKAVKISLNNKIYSKFTDNFGKITLNLNLKPNSYNAKITFEGDNSYKGSSINTIVTVKKAPLAIKTSNTKSYFAPETFFKAKVFNKNTKKPVEGIRVLFKVHSSKKKFKNYYAFTDKKGIATLNKRLKSGFYDVYTYIDDNSKKQFISYRNSKIKNTLMVADTREMGCSSIYVHKNENESAIAFRRDSTYGANLYIVKEKWYGRYALKQYKLTGTYFFHAITTSDGWLIGTGGWDNPTVNRNIEALAGKIVSSNSIKRSLLKSIVSQEKQLNTGHFAIVAPNGRYAVVWKSGYIKGKLKNGEYLDVPNLRSLFRHGKYKKYSKNPAKAALKIAATDVFGINRRNIMTYHYKRTTKNFKTNATVYVYGANDKGNLLGRFTAGKSDNVYFKKRFISKNKLLGTPNQKLIGTQKFGNIDKLFKTGTKVTVKNITSNLNQSTYLKVSLKNKKTKKALGNVKISLRIFTGKEYVDYLLKTDKNGIAKFNTGILNLGIHNVLINTANNKYIISGKTSIFIQDPNL